MLLYLAGVVLFLVNMFEYINVYFLHYFMVGMGTWILVSMYRRYKKTVSRRGSDY